MVGLDFILIYWFAEISSDDLEIAISSRQGQGILLLLDNIDELSSSEEFNEIRDVIRGHVWPQCGIITTSKPPHPHINPQGYSSGEDTKHYRVCFIDGFNNAFDIRNEVRRFFDVAPVAFSKDERITMMRHICNLLRIYHRDIYEGYYSSPVLCSILCNAFLRCIETKGNVLSN